MTASRKCVVCQEKLQPRQKLYCSDAHRKLFKRYGDEGAQERYDAIWDESRQCAECGRSLAGKALSAITCEGACRQARYERRRSIGQLAALLTRVSGLRAEVRRSGDLEAEAAFFDRISPVPDSGHDLGECWAWQGSRNGGGYGQASYRGKKVDAHRLAYLLFVGPIPDGYVIDHVCRNRGCANPLHLEAVTELENLLRGNSPAAINARKVECDSGHPFDDENTYVDRRNRRQCKTCRREAMRRYRDRHPEQAEKSAAYAREWRQRKRAERQAVAA